MIPDTVKILGPVQGPHQEILTPEAVAFLAKLHNRFDARRQELLARRHKRQEAIDAGELPGFLPETAEIRQDDSWKVAPIPQDLLDRRTEITGPVERKMVINALNSGASVFMADFEDANSPTWANNLDGHINLRDAIRRTISFENPDGKKYKLNEKTACCWCGLAAGILSRSTCRWTGSRCPADFSILGCTSSTMPRN